MVAEARRLFATRGYVATTIEDIAAASGLAVPTVYKHFGSKHAILAALIDVTIDQRVPELLAGVLDQPDPRHMIDRLADMCVALAAQAPDVVSTIIGAASVDPEFAELLAQMEEGRRRSASLVAHSLAEHGALGPNYSESDARDLIWALAGPELYELLALRSGWGDERFKRWLVQALDVLLL